MVVNIVYMYTVYTIYTVHVVDTMFTISCKYTLSTISATALGAQACRFPCEVLGLKVLGVLRLLGVSGVLGV